MTERTLNIPDETDAQVRSVLGDESYDAFAAEALAREARRRTTGQKLADAVKEARDSGTYDGTVDDLMAEARAEIDRVEREGAG